MGKGIQDIGNGLGYIYVTSPDGHIQYTYENTPDNVRKVKLDGVRAASIGGNRSSTSIITVGTPTGNGAITAITIGVDNAIDIAVPIFYIAEITAEDLALLIVDRINNYSLGSLKTKYSAIRVGATLYIIADTTLGVINNTVPSLVNTGNWTYTVVQEFGGGSSMSEIWDESFGYNFYLDADYGATQCSGGGVATVSSILNAINITAYIVNIGLQASLPKTLVTLANNVLVSDRKSLVSIVYITGESAANDELDSIALKGSVEGDRIILTGKNNITIRSGFGNIELQTSTYLVTGTSFLCLIYSSSTGTWFELGRSVMEVSDNGITTVKILDLAVTTTKINDLAVTTTKINDLAVTTTKINDLAVTTAKVETTLKTDLILVPISWDSNRIGDHKIIIPFPCTINKVDVYSDGLIAGVDDANANFKNNALLSMGVITFNAGDNIGTGYSFTPTTNNTFTAGQVLTITTTKPTPGGNAKASIQVIKS